MIMHEKYCTCYDIFQPTLARGMFRLGVVLLEPQQDWGQSGFSLLLCCVMCRRGKQNWVDYLSHGLNKNVSKVKNFISLNWNLTEDIYNSWLHLQLQDVSPRGFSRDH